MLVAKTIHLIRLWIHLDFFLQMTVASVLGVGAHRGVVKVKRMGGGFGGKESRFGIFTFTLFLTFNFHSHVDPFL